VRSALRRHTVKAEPNKLAVLTGHNASLDEARLRGGILVSRKCYRDGVAGGVVGVVAGADDSGGLSSPLFEPKSSEYRLGPSRLGTPYEVGCSGGSLAEAFCCSARTEYRLVPSLLGTPYEVGCSAAALVDAADAAAADCDAVAGGLALPSSPRLSPTRSEYRLGPSLLGTPYEVGWAESVEASGAPAVGGPDAGPVVVGIIDSAQPTSAMVVATTPIPLPTPHTYAFNVVPLTEWRPPQR
jgi:hypothetical protein